MPEQDGRSEKRNRSSSSSSKDSDDRAPRRRPTSGSRRSPSNRGSSRRSRSRGRKPSPRRSSPRRTSPRKRSDHRSGSPRRRRSPSPKRRSPPRRSPPRRERSPLRRPPLRHSPPRRSSPRRSPPRRSSPPRRLSPIRRPSPPKRSPPRRRTPSPERRKRDASPPRQAPKRDRSRSPVHRGRSPYRSEPVMRDLHPVVLEAESTSSRVDYDAKMRSPMVDRLPYSRGSIDQHVSPPPTASWSNRQSLEPPFHRDQDERTRTYREESDLQSRPMERPRDQDERIRGTSHELIQPSDISRHDRIKKMSLTDRFTIKGEQSFRADENITVGIERTIDGDAPARIPKELHSEQIIIVRHKSEGEIPLYTREEFVTRQEYVERRVIKVLPPPEEKSKRTVSASSRLGGRENFQVRTDRFESDRPLLSERWREGEQKGRVTDTRYSERRGSESARHGDRDERHVTEKRREDTRKSSTTGRDERKFAPRSEDIHMEIRVGGKEQFERDPNDLRHNLAKRRDSSRDNPIDARHKIVEKKTEVITRRPDRGTDRDRDTRRKDLPELPDFSRRPGKYVDDSWKDNPEMIPKGASYFEAKDKNHNKNKRQKHEESGRKKSRERDKKKSRESDRKKSRRKEESPKDSLFPQAVASLLSTMKALNRKHDTRDEEWGVQRRGGFRGRGFRGRGGFRGRFPFRGYPRRYGPPDRRSSHADSSRDEPPLGRSRRNESLGEWKHDKFKEVEDTEDNKPSSTTEK